MSGQRLSVRSGESPLTFLTRHGHEVSLYPGLVIVRKYDRKTGRVVHESTAETIRLAAIDLGWYS